MYIYILYVIYIQTKSSILYSELAPLTRDVKNTGDKQLSVEQHTQIIDVWLFFRFSMLSMVFCLFYTSWKHQKVFGFLMFLGGIKRVKY